MAYPIIDTLAGPVVSIQGQILPADAPAALTCRRPSDEKMFYEVIRVTGGVPLFWEDHMARLEQSIRGERDIPAGLYAESIGLIRACGLNEANLRLVLTRNQRVLHMIPSYYPDIRQIEQGVPTGILVWEREDPNTKIIRADYKDAVAARFAQPGPYGPYFELLLADKQGCLTEGSRSNLFFIRDGAVLSAPDDRILKGITRQYVMQAIADAGLSLRCEMLTEADIRADGRICAFLSGSPIDLLPIMAIDSQPLASAQDPLFRRLRLAYMEIVARYIHSHQPLGQAAGLPGRG